MELVFALDPDCAELAACELELPVDVLELELCEFPPLEDELPCDELLLSGPTEALAPMEALAPIGAFPIAGSVAVGIIIPGCCCCRRS